MTDIVSLHITMKERQSPLNTFDKVKFVEYFNWSFWDFLSIKKTGNSFYCSAISAILTPK